VKVAQERIHHCHISSAAPKQRAPGFILRGSMQPHAVENDVVRCPPIPRPSQGYDASPWSVARNLYPYDTIVVSAIIEGNGTG
jgi:hypothetical protein